MCFTICQLKMWLSVEPVLSKVSFLFYWPFIYLLLPICLISSPTVMYSSLWLFVRNSSLLHLYDVMDRSLPSLFPFPFPGFSFLFFNFCPFFLLLFITCPSNLPLCLFYPVTSPQRCSYFCIHLLLTPLSPSSTPPHFTTPCSPDSSSFASSTGWLSLRSSPWSLQRQCTTTSTLGPQTTSTFRQGNGS